MRKLKYFLNHQCVYASLSHVRLCLSLSLPPIDSVMVDDHFDMHLGYYLCTIFWKIKETHKIAFCSVFAGSTVDLSVDESQRKRSFLTKRFCVETKVTTACNIWSTRVTTII